MPVIEYTPKTFSSPHLAVIEQAIEIAEVYRADGDDLTLRQLYYQFVARALIPNRDQEYKRLGSILNDARLAGLFDWTFMVDRTRNVEGGDGSNESPIEVIDPDAFYVALWEGQPHRIEVWVEKDALKGVVGRAANALRIPYFSCRGYTSSSEVWAAAQRIERYLDTDGVEDVTILHLGDHDPSGIDMTRDITSRLELFLDGDGYNSSDLTVERIALNMPQVRAYNPPPNPAKLTDSRSTDYVRRFGTSSWELDALEPRVLRDLIRTSATPLIDAEAMQARRSFERKGEAVLTSIRDHYADVVGFLEDNGWATPLDGDDADGDES